MTSIVNMKQRAVIRDEGPFACALAALKRGDFAEAEQLFSELLSRELSPNDQAFAINKRGVTRVGLEQRELARADFEAALALKPAHAPALTNLGNLLLEEGQVDAAIARYRSAIAADAEYGIAYLNLGVAYKRSGRIAEAVRALRQAQRLEERASASGSWRRARR
jgi:pentatricopeptide repeat protein